MLWKKIYINKRSTDRNLRNKLTVSAHYSSRISRREINGYVQAFFFSTDIKLQIHKEVNKAPQPLKRKNVVHF